MLAAGAAEGDAEVGKVTLEVFVDALCDDRHSVLQEEVDGGFALQKFDDGTVLACVGLVLGVATGIGEGPAVEDVAAAIACVVFRQALFVAETLHSDSKCVGLRRWNRGDGGGQALCDAVKLGQVVEEARIIFKDFAQVAHSQRYTLDEVGLALVEAAIAVGAEGLEDADEDVVPEVVYEVRVTVECDIVLQEFVSDGLRQVALGAVEERGNVILRGSAPPTLVINIIESS